MLQLEGCQGEDHQRVNQHCPVSSMSWPEPKLAGRRSQEKKESLANLQVRCSLHAPLSRLPACAALAEIEIDRGHQAPMKLN